MSDINLNKFFYVDGLINNLSINFANSKLKSRVKTLVVVFRVIFNLNKILCSHCFANDATKSHF
jgi:hypothetical protein